MDDLISRHAAMNHIENEHREWGDEYDAMQILGDLEDFPPAQQGQRWIPVSERLPEKNGRYLVTNTKWGSYEVDWNIFYKEPNGWLWEEGVTAWMPLPEPYKGEES